MNRVSREWIFCDEGLCRNFCGTAPHYIKRKCSARLSAMEVAADDAQHGFRVFVGQRYFIAVIRA